MSGAKSTAIAEPVTDDHQRENPLQQLLDSNLRQRVMEAIETLPEREKLD